MSVFTATPVGSINNYQQAKKKPQTTQRSYSTGLPYEPAPAQSFAAPPQAPQAGQMQRPDLSSSVTTQFQQTLRGRQTPSVPPPAPVGANRLGRPQTAAPTVSTPQAGLGDYGQLGRSLAQGYQNAVASPQAAPTVRQPAAVGQSWLGGTVEGNLYGQMNQTAGQIQRPQNVGIGQVGSELEQQLLSRLGTTGEDAIAARQRADYEADAGKRRQQLVADLQRFGVLGGQGVSAGAVSDVLGEYEGQVGRGLLDIEAQAQQRRDEDLARALGFSQYQSGLGLQNQSMDQAAQLANAQLQQQNRAQNLQGLGLAADVNAQDQARQFQNMLLANSNQYQSFIGIY